MAGSSKDRDERGRTGGPGPADGRHRTDGPRGADGGKPGEAARRGGGATPKTLVLYEQLRSAIASEEFLPGTRVSEFDLGRQYRVSRTPVREALARLEQDGLLERRGAALYVRERTPDEIIDVYRVRVYLEGAVAHDAARRRTSIDLVRLDAAADRCAEARTEDPAALQELNTAFHDALAEACHNQPLRELQARLTIQVAKLPSTTLAYPGRWQEAVREHYTLVDAIRRREAEEAERIAREHMRAARDIRLKLIAEELDREPS